MTEFDGALDAEVMRTVFARHADDDADVLACRVTRQRHRPGTRRFVQYAVTLRRAGGLAEELRVTGQWHADLAHADQLHVKLTRRSRRVADWRAPLPPVFHDATTGMLATTFPWDRRLPTLPDVVAGRVPRLLGSMAAWMGVPDSSVTGCAIETVRYREQLNAVCRYTVAAVHEGIGRSRTFFVKVYGDDRGADAVARLAWLARATPAGTGVARIQRAVAYDRRLRALVLAAAPGVPLDAVPLDHAGRLHDALTRVGLALAGLAGRPVPPEAPLPLVDRREAATRSATALAGSLPNLAPRIDAVMALAAQRLVATPPRLVHGDLKLEHVFLDGGDVWLIDLDSCHHGDALWDLALLQARWCAARDLTHDVRGLGDTGRRWLADAYLARADATAAGRLPALSALACLDVAAGLAKRQDHAWERRSAHLVELAERALDRRP